MYTTETTMPDWQQITPLLRVLLVLLLMLLLLLTMSRQKLTVWLL